MDLKFIWVNDYRILKKVGINFNHSGPHKFEYQSGSLLLAPNKKMILNFGSKITGVTAIAGKNGSGKSSICEIVLHTTATFVNGGFGYYLEFDGIVCYGDHVFCHNSIQLNNVDELTSHGYKLIKFDKSPFESMNAEWRNSFQKGGFIYYSNVLDIRSHIDEMNLTNISSQEFLSSELKYSTGYPYENFYRGKAPDFHNNKDKQSQIRLYHLGEGYRFTKFYVNFPEFLPFVHPTHFVLKSAYSGNNRWLSLHSFESYEIRDPFLRLEQYILNIIYPAKWVTSESEKKTIDNQVFKSVIHYLYKLNLIIATAIAKQSLPDIEKSRQFIFEGASSEIIFDDYEKVNELIALHKSFTDSANAFEGEIDPYSMRHYYEDMQDWRFVLIENLYVPNTSDSLSNLKKFIALEESILRMGEPNHRRISNYILLPYFSSGENSFFTFFSRIFDAIERHKAGYDNRDNLILFIDEAEVGFHPAWKKYFLKWLLDFLNDYIHSYTFQIVMTTHSPYLLSDLPSANILLLKKNHEGNMEIIPSEDFKTFGGNIHELLATSFSLNDGFIGEFAKHNIQIVIDKLNSWRELKLQRNELFIGSLQNIQGEKENVLSTISLIADIIVRNKLFEMFWEIFEDDSALNQEIKFLEERINSLKNRNNDDRN